MPALARRARFLLAVTALLSLLPLAGPPAPAAGTPGGVPATFRGAMTGDVLILRLALEDGEPRDYTVVLAGVVAPQPGIGCPDGRRTLAVQALGRRALEFASERLSTAERIRVHDPRVGPRGIRLAAVTVDGMDLGSLLLAEGLARPAEPGGRVQWCRE